MFQVMIRGLNMTLEEKQRKEELIQEQHSMHDAEGKNVSIHRPQLQLRQKGICQKFLALESGSSFTH